MLTFSLTLSVAKAAALKVGDPLAFYEVTATVIPVLFLALVYEARVLELLGPRLRFHFAQIVGLLAVGLRGRRLMSSLVSNQLRSGQEASPRSCSYWG